MTIGRLAQAAGVNIETIRYYQRRGLLVTPRRPLGGVRRYSPETLARLRFVRRAQELGFMLREIAELLKLGDSSCKETRAIAEHRLTDIEARIRDLQSMRATLGKLIRTCRAGNQPPCPIIASLERNTKK
ncbi:MerR family transcriptional regulator [Sulfuricaulis limicola]|uniref:Mercuric resistance operon regulatory protein n=1 Tax=Sulfuricaulis limicola TaxID=1620215 RepID=A0A1B4XEP6_9GAMM|nr:MerR family transcriptional regulator [Sulfuricaulis limicola]BAV33272.1 MerR family transcriptional regulator [Sulfuricaulis limicola]